MKTSTRNISITGLCVGILSVLSLISVSIGEIPYSFSVLGVFLVGGLLSPGYAGATCLCYLLLGAIGIPIFSRFTGGIGILFGPTGGFLIAYPLMAMLVAWVWKYTKKKTAITQLMGMIPALLLGYILGTSWFMLSTQSSFWVSVATCVLPFIWFDAIKIVVAVALLRRLPS